MGYISEECIDMAIAGDTAALLKIIDFYSDIIQNKANRDTMNENTLKSTKHQNRDYEERLKIKLILEISKFRYG